ncbi:hypothetical protein [Methylobacterium bullatum]|uniref:Uncharacterized protein n=1 Tax=Methylobacterium bullatum TaxID=570505 RepID=A0A679JRH2_9HYPH|nr:hypothetical protein MBLL_00770 [Methylobacterium bullatum]
MLKIGGLDNLQRELTEASKAMEEIDGELGTVSFNPNDPSSIEAAISEINRMIDERLGAYSDNSIIGPMIEEMKEKYREGLMEKAAAARLKGEDE